jgi:predicted secreted Zn-dependent protease
LEDRLQRIDNFGKLGLRLWVVWVLTTSPVSIFAPSSIPSELLGLANVEMVEFDVPGTTLPEIDKNLHSVAAARPDNDRKSVGFTEWQADYDNRGEIDADGQCRAADPRVTVCFRIVLPRLSDLNLEPAVRARWQRFRRNIEKHEALHVRVALAHAARVQHALESMTCEQLAMEIPKLVRRVRAEQQALDVGLCDAYARGDRSFEAVESCGWPYLRDPSVAVQPRSA